MRTRKAREKALAELTEIQRELALKKRSNAKLGGMYVRAERSRQEALRKLAECEDSMTAPTRADEVSARDEAWARLRTEWKRNAEFDAMPIGVLEIMFQTGWDARARWDSLSHEVPVSGV